MQFLNVVRILHKCPTEVQENIEKIYKVENPVIILSRDIYWYAYTKHISHTWYLHVYVYQISRSCGLFCVFFSPLFSVSGFGGMMGLSHCSSHWDRIFFVPRLALNLWSLPGSFPRARITGVLSTQLAVCSFHFFISSWTLFHGDVLIIQFSGWLRFMSWYIIM